MMHGETARSNPTVQVLPWDLPLDYPTANNMPSPFSVNHNTNTNSPSGDFDGMAALHRYLPSNTPDFQIDEDGEVPVDAFSIEQFRMFEFKVRKGARGRYLPSNTPDFQIDEDGEVPVDAFSSEHFRMFEFKVRKCARGRSHDWSECPYAHPGESSRRRDPRRFQYSGTPCPDFRKGYCNKGDSCDFAHGVFECWLHPSRYRTQPCEDGTHCRRRVCFFAHTPDQLRVLPHHGSPRLGDSCDGHRVDSVTTRTPRRGHSGRRRPRLRIPRQFRRRLTRHHYVLP